MIVHGPELRRLLNLDKLSYFEHTIQSIQSVYILDYHNIIHIQNNVMRNWQYFVIYSHTQRECEEYST